MIYCYESHGYTPIQWLALFCTLSLGLRSVAGVIGVFFLQALFHVVAGVLIAGFLMPEGPVVVILGLAVVAVMKAVYSYLDKGRLASTQVGYVGFLLAGGVLYMLYRLFF